MVELTKNQIADIIDAMSGFKDETSDLQDVVNLVAEIATEYYELGFKRGAGV